MAARNVLMLSLDDLRSLEDWGHFASLVRTPNLDRLAAMGTTFDRAITQVPICNPSRSSVFTGQQPSQTGILDNAVPWFERVDAADTLPAVLREAGAYVAMFGKNFHATPIDATRMGLLFDEFFHEPSEGDPAKVARDDVFHNAPFKSGRYNGPVSDLHDEHSVAAALDFLENRAGGLNDPFFLSVGISKPHLNWWLPPKYFALYDQSTIRAALKRSLADGTIIPGDIEYADVPPMSRPSADHAPMAADLDLWVDYLHGYLAAVSYADAKIGQVLDALEADPALAAETAIVLWSDNGYLLGDHNRWQKFTNWRQATEVPLIVVDPDVEGGQIAKQVVSLTDIFPTVLDLMGIAVPDRLDLSGESLVPIVEDLDVAWYNPASGRGVALTAVLGAISIRAVVPGYGDIRYTRYPDGKEEIYNLTVDPDEHVNRLNYKTGAGLTAADETLHDIVADLLHDRLAEEGMLLSNGRTGLTGTAADKLLVSFIGPGTDTLRGGSGDDTYVVYRASSVVENAGNGYDAIFIQNTNLEKSFVLPANVELVQVSQHFTGNAAGNVIIAGGFTGALSGMGGSDTLRSGRGAFVLDGGDGSDDLTGLGGNDTLLGGNGNDTLAGGGKNDALAGGAGADQLSGATGSDTLKGNAGADVLMGGDDNDLFVYVSAQDLGGVGVDTITDFKGAGAAAGDRIDFSAIDANSGLAGNQAFHWGGTGPGDLRAVEEGGKTVILGNLDADAASELRIVIADGNIAASSYVAQDVIL